VFKKVFKILTTLTLLAGCYFGYVHVFAIVVVQLKAIKHTENLAFPIPRDSKSLLDSIRYAEEACGPGHWATEKELAYRYYNAERGYWIYAKECIKVTEENGVQYNGKRLRMKPFLLITKSRDGKNTKTITADRAVFDLNAPLGFDAGSGREPLKIKHAHLEPNVVIRDDKGTPRDLKDDMYTKPITTVDYDESTQQITTEVDTYVVMIDPETVTTANGMIMQLRKPDVTDTGGSSSGFEGMEWLDLLKNVHVVMRDVGNSGILPGAAPGNKATAKKGQSSIDVAGNSDPKTEQLNKPAKPTPLDLTCDSKMHVVLPKSKPPVLAGPPELPLPTFAQFERNVVVLRGDPSDQPEQLTCDTLQLTLVPAEKSLDDKASASAPQPNVVPSTEAVAQSVPESNESPQPDATGNTNESPLGGLTLQRLHATGHAVWLILPANGVKLRCNEMIHARQLPLKPDMTYFRGDRTRPVEIVKIDYEHTKDEENDEEESDQKIAKERKILSVTNIWTEDVTLLDSGTGTDIADVYAHGPGRMETRPDRDQPVERIAIWQDTLIVKNKLGPNNELVHKVIDLTGSRPCFIDNLQKTSLDSAFWIQVWLKPKPAPVKTVTDNAIALAKNPDNGPNNADSTSVTGMNELAGSSTVRQSTPSTKSDSDAGTEDGGLQIEQLHALLDVHLLAPSKTMTARDRFDAEFVEALAQQLASTAQTKPVDNSRSTTGAPSASETASPDETNAQSDEQVTAQDSAEKPSDDPPMTGSCNRLWARIVLKPKPAVESSASEQTQKSKTAATKPGSSETDAEIRKVWMWGNVALHQDPKKEKDKPQTVSNGDGTNASGEALYLDNRGPNLAVTYIYQRDPTERTYLPGPLPPACVDARDKDPKKITAAGTIKLNQETDQAWATGPGTLTQLTARAFLTDKAPEAEESGSDAAPADDANRQAELPEGQVKVRSTSMVRNDGADEPIKEKAKEKDTKPKTRAGLPLSQKVPMTIGFSEKMEFAGRSVDPEQRPAARADFHGIVTAEMEDAMLHATEKMIAFTDREVPLTQVSKKSQEQPAGEPEPQAELTLIYCYRNAVGVSRKVDPDFPEPIQQQRIEADTILAYDRRNGDFYIKGRGKVFLFDRSENSSSKEEPDADTDDNKNGSGDKDSGGDRNPNLAKNERTLTQTSSSAPNYDQDSTGKRTSTRQVSRRSTQQRQISESTVREVPAMVLTQIHFNDGMRGRLGNGKENDNTESRWSEFHGNVETCRAKVANTLGRFNFDHPPEDAVYLTGQILRVIQEPRPVGSPESTPARQYLKVWENAQARNQTKIISADVITYDSFKDLVYAYGEDGHSVLFAEQHAAGQQMSNGSSEAVQLNPKTGGIRVINSNTVALIDKNTGYRPTATGPDDPYAKKKKSLKRPFTLPTANLERRGWTGQ
jgi:hypothetical protein